MSHRALSPSPWSKIFHERLIKAWIAHGWSLSCRKEVTYMGMGLFIDEKVSKIVNRLKGRIVTCFTSSYDKPILKRKWNCFYGHFGKLGHFRKFHSYREVLGKRKIKNSPAILSFASCFSMLLFVRNVKNFFFRILAYGRVPA